MDNQRAHIIRLFDTRNLGLMELALTLSEEFWPEVYTEIMGRVKGNRAPTWLFEACADNEAGELCKKIMPNVNLFWARMGLKTLIDVLKQKQPA